jgi:flagellar motility protein MotE (MotC chaperone)
MPLTNSHDINVILEEWYPEGTMKIESKVDGIECTTIIEVSHSTKDISYAMLKEDYEDKVRRRLADKYRKFRKLETKNPDQYKKYVDATNGEGTFILSDLYERQSRAKKSNTEKAISLFESMSPEEKEKALALLQSK